jgi:NADPH:quinone reductase-like Zn-dependent oxidoreductase
MERQYGMKYWCFDKGFGLDNLVIKDGSVPKPGPRDVLLEMKAASLNYRDLVVMRGQHGRSVQPPLIPLSDGVGVIVAKGEQVTDFETGDRVIPCFYQHWLAGAPPTDLEVGRLGGPLNGVLSSHAIFPSSSIVKAPEHLSDAEAATLPCAGVTAWSALMEPSPAKPGESVLIQGSGGVALIALALAQISGLKTIMTTSNAKRADQLFELGADSVIDRSQTSDWAKAVRDITDGVGCDRVLELGGAATLGQSIKAVKTGGTIILIGNVTGNTAELFLPLVLTRRLTLHSVSCGSMEALQSLAQAMGQHKIKPLIAHDFTFDEAPKAFEQMQDLKGLGKVCITI